MSHRYTRDESSGALVLADQSAYKARLQVLAAESAVESVKDEINTLKAELQELKSLLKKST